MPWRIVEQIYIVTISGCVIIAHRRLGINARFKTNYNRTPSVLPHPTALPIFVVCTNAMVDYAIVSPGVA
eukprot:scaffold60022_cov35-Tisochrysis_lutea.AAC.1